MPRSKYQVISAIFDIKPVNGIGEINVEKISNVEPLLNLGRKLRIGKSGQPTLKSKASSKKQVVRSKRQAKTDQYEDLVNPAGDLEKYLNEDINLDIELAAMGAEVIERTNLKPRYKPILKNSKKQVVSSKEPNFLPPITDYEESPEDYQDVLRKINEKISLTGSEFLIGEPKRTDITDWWQETQKKKNEESDWKKPIPAAVFLISHKFSKITLKKFILGISALIIVGLTAEYGFTIKNEIIHNGSSAVVNLESAGENIKKLDFTAASNNFSQAYGDFAKAGDNLNFMGATMSSLIADLPGGGKLKSAKKLVEAGKLMADAGQAMSQAIEELARTGLIFNPANSSASIGGISKNLRQALVLSQNNIKKAGELLGDVDAGSIPEDKQASFNEFNSKLPEFEKLITDAVDYSKFLEDLIGTTGTKKYLLLFQNPAELRPTGGFPGSYGILVFKDGKLQDFRVDDVYNLDGQLKELYVPPLELQHITPNWAMRDVNWFVDFPVSARKVTEFYKKESGEDVDGVITFSPKIVSKILEITGPIRMDKYNITLSADNFQQSLQEEIEYKADRAQPKKILVDLAPLMLEKIYSADSDNWMEIFNILVSSVDGKDILMYFRDLKLQDFSVAKGFSGQINQTQDDYLMVTFTNIKGSKTDSVIDSDLRVDTVMEGEDVYHRVVLTRTHNGGGTKYGFYNKQSPTYVRVLVPNDAQFLGISGNSRPNFEPLLNYSKTDFKRDEDLVRFEEKSNYDKETGVTLYEESGKREYGFWMLLDPGKTKIVELEYRVSGKATGGDYEFYMQKQPGLEFKNFKLNIDGASYFDGQLDRDMIIKAKIQK